jgi:hypothetical protein
MKSSSGQRCVTVLGLANLDLGQPSMTLAGPDRRPATWHCECCLPVTTDSEIPAIRECISPFHSKLFV